MTKEDLIFIDKCLDRMAAFLPSHYWSLPGARKDYEKMCRIIRSELGKHKTQASKKKAVKS